MSGWRRCGVSFDDLVGAGEDGWRDGEAERRGGFEINDQLEFRWLLDWQIGGLCAFEDLIDINGDAALPKIEDAGAVGHEPAVIDEVAQPVHCRETVRSGESDDAFPIRDQKRVGIDNKTIRVLLGDRAKRYREIRRLTHLV